MGRFEQRTVMVTGGGGGIGSALCRGFAAEGAAVAVLDRSSDAAAAVAGPIADTGGRVLAIECDITERDSVDAAVETVTNQLGPIDVLVNNAGLGPFRLVLLDAMPATPSGKIQKFKLRELFSDS